MPAEIDDLCHSSQQAAKVAWGDVPPVAVGEGIEGLCRARNQADAALLAAVRSFEVRAEHRAEGHTSVAFWLRHHCRLRKRTALRIARLARFLDRVPPVLGEALARGEIGFDHVEALADAHKDRYAEAWGDALPLLVDYAIEARFEDFDRQVQRFADRLDPRDPEERFEQQWADRRFTKAATIDGYGYLRGWMDPITFAIFSHELDRLERIEFDHDWAAARDVLGRDPTNIELEQVTRTPGQRYNDALGVMAQRSKALAGGVVAAAADVILHCDQESYEAALARLLGDDDAEYPPGGFCETDTGQVISPIAAVYLSLVGHVRQIVFSAEGEILSFGRGRRLFTPAQAAALRAKFRRCAHPYGCDRTGPLLQADHIVEHEDGGGTDTTNGQCLCGFHNRWKNRHKHDPPPPAGTRRDTGQRRAPPSGLC